MGAFGKKINAAILLWLSAVFLMGKSHKGKHLTAIEMSKTPVAIFCSFCYCKKLKIPSRNWGKTVLLFILALFAKPEKTDRLSFVIRTS